VPKITEKPLVKMKLRLFEEDYERLRTLFGPNIGINKAIRSIVHSFLNQTDAKIRDKIDSIEGLDAP